jgi:hypothetical protein
MTASHGCYIIAHPTPKVYRWILDKATLIKGSNNNWCSLRKTWIPIVLQTVTPSGVRLPLERGNDEVDVVVQCNAVLGTPRWACCFRDQLTRTQGQVPNSLNATLYLILEIWTVGNKNSQSKVNIWKTNLRPGQFFVSTDIKNLHCLPFLYHSIKCVAQLLWNLDPSVRLHAMKVWKQSTII